MQSIICVLVEHLRISDRLLKSAMKDLSFEELHRRAGPESSNLIWITGHLALSRLRMLELVGGAVSKEHRSWAVLFTRGSSIHPPSKYPEIDELLKFWDEVNGHLAFLLPEMREPELEADSGVSLPVSDKSVGSALAFLTYHEAYHIGQMGYIRKMLGHSSLVG